MDVQQFLQRSGVAFEKISHRQAEDAQRLAHAMHVPGDRVAKTVLLRADDGYALAVIPATHMVDMHLAGEMLGAERVDLAGEDECGRHFGDCELGALPPFGSRYRMKTLVDQSLTRIDEFVFEGNNHREAIRMKTRDFMALERPLIGNFARRAAFAAR